MARIKSFDELTFSDNFIFCATLTEYPELCAALLSLLIGRPVTGVALADGEKAIRKTADGRGIRLDVYVEDEAGEVFNVEMQVANEHNLPLRSRYYQSMLDLHQLKRSMRFEELRRSYVIFICMFDPFGEGLYRYTVRPRCEEKPELAFDDRSCKMFLNARAVLGEVPEGFRALFGYLCSGEPTDSLTEQIDRSVRAIKSSEEWRAEYVILEEMLQDQREEGRKEGWQEGLAEGRQEGNIEGRAEERQESALRMHRSGFTIEQIELALGMGRAEIESIIREHEECGSGTTGAFA